MLVTAVLLYFAHGSVINPEYPLGGDGRVVVIKSASQFCMFLPPKPGVTIAESEGYPFATGEHASKIATSYCTTQLPEAPGSLQFYDDFFTGVHYRLDEKQVQITGRFNASKAGIPIDGGGYYDFDNNVNSPPGGICYGYDSFYNFVSPENGIFCIKCCKGIQGCEIWNGEKGCEVMVPGNYELGFDEEIPKTGKVLPEIKTEPKTTPTPAVTNWQQKALSSLFWVLGLVNLITTM